MLLVLQCSLLVSGSLHVVSCLGMCWLPLHAQHSLYQVPRQEAFMEQDDWPGPSCATPIGKGLVRFQRCTVDLASGTCHLIRCDLATRSCCAMFCDTGSEDASSLGRTLGNSAEASHEGDRAAAICRQAT